MDGTREGSEGNSGKHVEVKVFTSNYTSNNTKFAALVTLVGAIISELSLGGALFKGVFAVLKAHEKGKANHVFGPAPGGCCLEYYCAQPHYSE